MEIMEQNEIDFDASYTVDGYARIAFRLLGWDRKFEPTEYWEVDPDTGDEYLAVDHSEGEWVDDPESGKVRAVMVGDDRTHVVDVEDLTAIADDDYCGGCGQVGCGWC